MGLKLKKMSDTDRGYRALIRRLLEVAPRVSFTVGIHAAEGDAQYEHPTDRGGPVDNTVITLSELGEIHEFGLGVPQRSWLGDWFDENQPRLVKQISGVAKAVLKGKVDSLQNGFEQLGSLYVGEIQKRIAQRIDPPLSEYTIKKKGSSVPLIDTEQLRSAITFKVTTGDS